MQIKTLKIETPHKTSDPALKAAYTEAQAGNTLIDLQDVMAKAGFDKKTQLPVLCIARANRKWGWYRAHIQGEMEFEEFRIKNPKRERSGGEWVRALVPSIPAHIAEGRDLDEYFVLWEAEWEDELPTDPWLLRHIGGTLFVVVAHWNLSEAEKALLSARFGSVL